MTSHSPSEGAEALFTRDGHVSELCADQLLLGELSPAGERAVRRHMADCGRCREYLDRLEAFDRKLEASGLLMPRPDVMQAAESDPAAPISLAQARVRRQARMRTLAKVAGLCAAAAVTVLVMRSQLPKYPPGAGPAPASPTDVVRSKASALDLALYARGSEGVRRVYDQDIVHPGELLGFEAFTTRAGYLLVVDIDHRGTLFVAYPARDGGEAEAIDMHRDGVKLNAALEFDQVLGKEHIAAMLCPRPFALAEAESALREALREPAPTLPAALDGCARRVITLRKVARSEVTP